MARFRPGERVAVRRADPPGHLRTPWYCRGKFGVIERLCGEFGNPEALAYGLSGDPERPLYRVRFSQQRALAGLSRRHERQRRDRDLRALARTRLRSTTMPDPHDHDDHDHGHEHTPRSFQPDLEDQPQSDYQFLEVAVRELLIEKGVITRRGRAQGDRGHGRARAPHGRPDGGAGLDRPGL